MSKFELVRFGCGHAKPCLLTCGGPNSCRMRMSGDLDEAIATARELIAHDPLDVVEIREGGKLIRTVGASWVSHAAT
jgi:hypothetical protein